MAIINSMGVGRSKKSMGNVTYRVVRGRTIGSQKRGKGETGATTRGLSGNVRKPLFAMINSFMKAHDTDIQVSFNKSQYGSQRNYFFSNNYAALSVALQALATAASNSGVMPMESEIETAITSYATANPTAIYRVKLAGFENVYLSGAWDSADNPVAGGSSDGLGVGTAQVLSSDGTYKYNSPVAISLSQHNGAKIVHLGGSVQIKGTSIPAGITAPQIVYLTPTGVVSPAVTITGVTSVAGQLDYTTNELTDAQDAVAVQIGSIYVRLTSAYVRTEAAPLG